MEKFLKLEKGVQTTSDRTVFSKKVDQCVQTTEDRKKKANTRQESHPTCSRAGPVPVCTRLLGAFAPFTVRQRDLSRDGSLGDDWRMDKPPTLSTS